MEDRRFEIPAKFTALNGSLQYYKVAVAGVNFVTEQDKMLALIDALKMKAQPVITKADGANVEFCLEQPHVWANEHAAQVKGAEGTRNMVDEAKANLKAHIEKAFPGKTVTVDVKDAI